MTDRNIVSNDRKYILIFGTIFWSWYSGWLTHSLLQDTLESSPNFWTVPILALAGLFLTIFLKQFKTLQSKENCEK